MVSALIERFIACQRDPALLVPGGRILSSPAGWCSVHPLPLSHLNTARPDAPDDRFLQEVSQAHAGVWSRWSLPEAHLGLRPALTALGYREGPTVELLWVEAGGAAAEAPGEGEVRALRTGEEAWRWALASWTLKGALGDPPGVDLPWGALVGPGSPHRLFVAERQGEIIGVAALQVCPGQGAGILWGAVTAPAWRGRGVHRRLLAARMAAARDEGLGLLFTLAGPTGAGPILSRRGFRGTGWWLVALERPPLGSEGGQRR